MKSLKNKQWGVSIVEMLVATAAGTLLIAGSVQIFVANKTTYTIQQGLARLQENGRFAQAILSKDIRMAAFEGCNNMKNLEPTMIVSNPTSLMQFNDNNSIGGHDGSGGAWSPALPPELVGKVEADTDVIIVRKIENIHTNLVSPMNHPHSPLIVDDRNGIEAGDVLMTTDCETVDIFMASANTNASAITHTVSVNISNDLSKAYQTDTQVSKLQFLAFYIKDSGRTNSSGQAIMSLFQMNIDGTEQELIEGIEDMQVTYGVDTTGDRTADTYQTATAVEAANNWPNVISVHISQLVNTVEEVSPTEKSYTFNGNAVSSPGDKLLRKQWDSFITLRNRSL